MSAPDGVAIITGAAGRLGQEIAARLDGEGRELLLVDLAPNVLEAAEELPRAEAVVADLTAPDGIAAVVEAVGERGVGLLVNNAGITRDGRVANQEPDDFRLVIEVNLVAAMGLSLAVESLLTEGSAVVNMSSRASLGNFGQANYSASKSGLVGMTRALALRWAPRTRVNAVAPSLVDTPMTQAMPPEVLEKLVARIPAGRIGDPADVADAVSFLASTESDYITGQVLFACGGRSIAP